MGTTCGRSQGRDGLVAMDGDVAEIGIDVLVPRQRQHVREPELRGEGGDGHGQPDVIAGIAAASSAGPRARW